MRAFKNTSIRRKQMFIIMLITSVALLLACAAFISFEIVNFRQEMVQDLSTLVKITAYNTSAALDFNQAQSAEEALQALDAQTNLIGACVYDRKGAVFATYDRPDDGIIFAPPATPPAFGHVFVQGRLALSGPITTKGDVIGTIYLESNMNSLHSALVRFTVITGAVCLLTLVVAFLLSARLQHLISEPILDLVRTAQTVAQDKDYSVRATKHNADEIGVLIDGFNEMLAQIQRRDAALEAGRRALEARVVERTRTARLAEEKYRSIFENSVSGIFQTTPEGRYLSVNPALARIYGYESKEALMNWLGDISRDLYVDPSRRAEFMRLTQEQGVVKNFESQIHRKDGTVIWISENARVVRDQAGAIEYYEGVVDDIDQRKRMEQQLTQSQRLETVGKLAGGVAHEFNSIMTAIIGQSELLLHDLPPGHPFRKNVCEIHHAADRAANLTRQLLAYGRKQILQPDVMDLNQVLTGMENTLRHLVGRDVDVKTAPADGAKLVKVDAGQIEQVIVNIVMNAADAMPRGGKLTLETGETVLDEEYVSHIPDLKAGEYVMLAITDTGTGMSEAVKARIFEPFFTTKGVGQGTGLGLATCHGIVKQSEGHISVYSELGRGAVFKIYLPKAQAVKKAPAPPLKAPGLPGGKETILLVEDDPALREMAATLLGRLGYTVLTAANGLEAMNVTHQRATGHIDLLFTDVVMPHMSGKELSDRIRSLYPRTRILFTSAYTENAIVHQGVLNQGVALLQKPYTPSSLAQRMRDVLDQPCYPANSNTS